ncbi:MAG: hypothetical protein ACYDEN_11235 [Acidimicrobiales bacterium]
MSRRRFLRTGTVTMAAAAAVGAVPGLPGLLGEAESDVPGAAPGATAAAGAVAPSLSVVGALQGPVTAHVSDLSGELSLFVENRTVVVRDPALVARLLAASR